MAEQGGLYTLVLKHPDGTRESRVVGSIVDYLLAVDDPDAVVEKMASPGDEDRQPDHHRGRVQLRPRHR